MNDRSLLPAALAACLLVMTGCGSSGDAEVDPVDVVDSAESASAAGTDPAQTNPRGAIEVPLGEPVTLVDEAGAMIVTLTGTALDASGCRAVDYQQIPQLAEGGLAGAVRQVKFIAEVEVRTYEYPEWLRPTDFYFTNDAGDIVPNAQVTALNESLAVPCEGSTPIAGLAPDSAARGSATLNIPVGVEHGGPDVIGYEVNGHRVEWRLPEGWAAQLPEPVFAGEQVPAE